MHADMYLPLGFGLGLRSQHYSYILEHKPNIDWFEIISENFMDTDGKPKRNLERVKEIYPIVMHGVSLSIGTVDVLNSDYLKKLKTLKDWLKPAWISDHLCWTGIAHRNTHDLLPIPYTDEALKHIIKRIKNVQDYLECPIALENPSTYLEFKHSQISEAEFIAIMAQESGCHLLLDINNVYVTCYNHKLDVKAYIDALPLDKVIQIHLAGHNNKGTYIIDTHDNYVDDAVWNLYKYVIQKTNRIPNTMIEWDDKIPDFEVLSAELNKARIATHDLQNYILPDLYTNPIIYNQTPVISLADTQHLVQNTIISGNKINNNLDEWIRIKPDFSPQKQIDIYINAYRYRLYDVIAEDYPVLKAYLGNDIFHDLIWGFVNNQYSDNFNIARLALKLPNFLHHTMPKNIFAYELCLLETRIVYVADLLETPALELHHLDGITPEILMDINLYPRKALELMRFTYPVNNYYQSVMNQENIKKPRKKVTFLVIFRHDDVMWRMPLEKIEYDLLKQLFNGVKIGDALNILDDSIAPKVSEYFSRWIRNGILMAYEHKNV